MDREMVQTRRLGAGCRRRLRNSLHVGRSLCRRLDPRRLLRQSTWLANGRRVVRLRAGQMLVAASLLGGCATIPEECARLEGDELKECRVEVAEYERVEYYHSVYLPKKNACKAFWVVEYKGTASRFGRNAEENMSKFDMIFARCVGSLNEVY